MKVKITDLKDAESPEVLIEVQADTTFEDIEAAWECISQIFKIGKKSYDKYPNKK